MILLYEIIPRAGFNLATGRFWPAGRMFDTPALGDVRVKNVAMVQTRECACQAPQLAKGIRPTKDLRPFFLQSEMNDSMAE